MKKTLSVFLCLLVVLSMAGCGSSDALKGTWTCQDNDYGTVIWKFDGSGKCSMENDWFEGEGTYTIDGSKVTIELDLWDEAIVYDFTVSDTSLKLTATNGLAADYDLTKK